jgi:hypothetical protein
MPHHEDRDYRIGNLRTAALVSYQLAPAKLRLLNCLSVGQP